MAEQSTALLSWVGLGVGLLALARDGGGGKQVIVPPTPPDILTYSGGIARSTAQAASSAPQPLTLGVVSFSPWGDGATPVPVVSGPVNGGRIVWWQVRAANVGAGDFRVSLWRRRYGFIGGVPPAIYTDVLLGSAILFVDPVAKGNSFTLDSRQLPGVMLQFGGAERLQGQSGTLAAGVLPPDELAIQWDLGTVGGGGATGQITWTVVIEAAPVPQGE